MKYSDYLFDEEDESLDLTSKLLLMDSALMQLHSSGRYVSSNILDAVIVDNKIIPESLRIDVFDPEKNDKDYAQDIMELCAIGICAYNHFGEYGGYPKYFTTPDFINSLVENVEPFLTREDIPEEIKDYYRTIFTLLDLKYMNYYLEEIKKGGGKDKARVYTYSTAAGRAFANQENNSAFTVIVAIPAILSLIYMVSVIVIFLVKALS